MLWHKISHILWCCNAVLLVFSFNILRNILLEISFFIPCTGFSFTRWLSFCSVLSFLVPMQKKKSKSVFFELLCFFSSVGFFDISEASLWQQLTNQEGTCLESTVWSANIVNALIKTRNTLMTQSLVFLWPSQYEANWVLQLWTCNCLLSSWIGDENWYFPPRTFQVVLKGKLTLFFMFILSCGAPKRFLKALKALTKPFEAPQRIVKTKIFSWFFLFVWDRDGKSYGMFLLVFLS